MQLLQELQDRGFKVSVVKGDTLKVIPGSKLTPELIERLRTEKPRLIKILMQNIAPDKYEKASYISRLQIQMDAYLDYGFPEAFRILFYNEMLPDGSIGPVRLESWTYYSQGVELSFLNGEKTGVETINNPQLGDLILPTYYPEQFTAYMSLAEVMTAASLDQYAVIPLEKDFLEGSEVYYGPQLSFGMMDGELRMVEVMGITE